MDAMIAKRQTQVKSEKLTRYRGADIPMSVIRRFARQVVEQFQPDKIILFGSYAYGLPHADNDVDILVVMQAKNVTTWPFEFATPFAPPFQLISSCELPSTSSGAYEKETGSCAKSSVKGKSSMKKATKAWVRKAEDDYQTARNGLDSKTGLNDQVCLQFILFNSTAPPASASTAR